MDADATPVQVPLSVRVFFAVAGALAAAGGGASLLPDSGAAFMPSGEPTPALRTYVEHEVSDRLQAIERMLYRLCIRDAEDPAECDDI